MAVKKNVPTPDLFDLFKLAPAPVRKATATKSEAQALTDAKKLVANLNGPDATCYRLDGTEAPANLPAWVKQAAVTSKGTDKPGMAVVAAVRWATHYLMLAVEQAADATRAKAYEAPVGFWTERQVDGATTWTHDGIIVSKQAWGTDCYVVAIAHQA